LQAEPHRFIHPAIKHGITRASLANETPKTGKRIIDL